MIRSLFSGVSGLKTHQQKMDVIGNNIANVNTTGFKTSVATFQEVYYQTKKNASTGSAIQGGINPSQVGYGAKLGAIGQIMGQSGFTYSDSVYDCALSGDGFFQVMDAAGSIFYTRAGVFNVDNAGNLVDSNGNMVLGVSGDATGVDPSSNRITFAVPEVLDNNASYSKDIIYNGSTYPLTVSAASATPDGNISVGFLTGDSDYAYLSGTKLVVQLNKNNDYTSPKDVEDAIARACENGGVEIPGVLPLSFQLDTIPPADEVPATISSNVMKGLSGDTTPAKMTMYIRNPANNQVLSYLDFQAVEAGAFANDYSVQLTASANGTTSASWAGNKLTISVAQGATAADLQAAIDDASNGNPQYQLTVNATSWNNVANNTTTLLAADNTKQMAGGQDGVTLKFETTLPGEYGNNYVVNLRYSKNAEETTAKWTDNGLTINLHNGATVADIQLAIDKAAGENEKYQLKVTGNGWDEAQPMNLEEILEVDKKIGLAGGSNNIYSDMVELLGNIKLTDGRVAAEQTVKDLDSVYINEDGTVYGVHNVHGIIMLGRIDIVTFDNPNGLEQVGSSYWRETLASGEPQINIAGENGSATVVSGALEMSNVDLSQEFSDMIITQRGFQANSRIITTSDTMLEEIVNLKR